MTCYRGVNVVVEEREEEEGAVGNYYNAFISFFLSYSVFDIRITFFVCQNKCLKVTDKIIMSSIFILLFRVLK